MKHQLSAEIMRSAFYESFGLYVGSKGTFYQKGMCLLGIREKEMYLCMTWEAATASVYSFCHIRKSFFQGEIGFG